MIKKLFLAISIIFLVVINVRICGPLIFGGGGTDDVEQEVNNYEQDTLTTSVDCAYTSSLVEPMDNLNENLAASEIDATLLPEEEQGAENITEHLAVSEVDTTLLSEDEQVAENINEHFAVSEVDTTLFPEDGQSDQFGDKVQKLTEITKELQGEITTAKQEAAESEQQIKQQIEVTGPVSMPKLVKKESKKQPMKMTVSEEETTVERPSTKARLIKKTKEMLDYRENLDKLIDSLSRRADFGEVGMQTVLNLLDIEVTIVNRLLGDSGGYNIEKKVAKRDKTIKRSILSAVRVRDMILDVATFKAHIDAKLRDYMKANKNRLWQALRSNDKQAFLDHVKDTLVYYFNKIRDTQYEMVSF